MYRKYKLKTYEDYLSIGPLVDAQAKEWIMNSYNTIVSIDGMPFNNNGHSWSISGNKWELIAESSTLEGLENVGKPVDVTIKPRVEVFPNVFVGDVVIYDIDYSCYNLKKMNF
jgi:hypothetical protein